MGVARRRLYQAHGVADLHDLAALDWTTAELAHARVDLPDLLAKAEGLAAQTPWSTVIAGRTKQLDVLARHDMVRVGDLAGLDRATLGLCAAGAGNLSTQGSTWPGPAWGPSPRPTASGACGRISVGHGADVEVDVDMENAEDGCYLWGAYVSTRSPAWLAPRLGPFSFASWDPDLAAGELDRLQGLLVLAPRTSTTRPTPRAPPSAPTATPRKPRRAR